MKTSFRFIIPGIVGLFLFSCSSAQEHPYATSEILSEPQLFAPGIISTDAREYAAVFTPDGNSVYFTRRVSREEPQTIYVSHFSDGAWQDHRTLRDRWHAMVARGEMSGWYDLHAS